MLLSIIISLLLLPQLASTRTENCFRFASSFSFAPCIQCLNGYYLMSSRCWPCNGTNYALKGQIKSRCDESNFYGSNIGSLLDLFSQINIDHQPSEIPQNLKIETNCKQFSNSQIRNLIINDYKVYKIPDSAEVICIECQPGFALSSTTGTCSRIIQKIQTNSSPLCSIYSVPQKKCLQCLTGYVISPQNGSCVRRDFVDFRQGDVFQIPVREGDVGSLDRSYKVIVKENGIPFTSEHLVGQVSDIVEELLILPPASTAYRVSLIQFENIGEDDSGRNQFSATTNQNRTTNNNNTNEGTDLQNHDLHVIPDCIRYSEKSRLCLQCKYGLIYSELLNKCTKSQYSSLTYTANSKSFWQVKYPIYSSSNNIYGPQHTHCISLNGDGTCSKCEKSYYLDQYHNCLSNDQFRIYLLRKYSYYNHI